MTPQSLSTYTILLHSSTVNAYVPIQFASVNAYTAEGALERWLEDGAPRTTLHFAVRDENGIIRTFTVEPTKSYTITRD